ncbi:heavy-metal-associated domain-containing protein [Staphylococcus aureus]|uniref:HMA domain-containing protein n=1 Tax=Staphylococcus aureus TaxID=1280 RepID=A0A380DTB0_STAAU|nr:heavy metal-associated domain-containing protein [Staphylococcus aureus]MBW5881205.1 heavy-metal-associated domain-containing protein [Staphylococcus aureus]MBW5883704.1 heavy-metal-associated domain-containing protein [Staphylococcus aureus]MCQ1429064.1 heavy-metal-associated domain-containing protein [Staphylococcus aureus]NDP97375.1 heavy-metal-associated domain-containing protein [Staphylococcus aureus]NDR16585.1 heavy-metal-associated domain-containing protein [Staphylococcus aureus]
MIHQNTIYTSGIETEEQVSQLTERISNMIGVHQVNINIIDGQVIVSYETPANLNSIEKEIYDEGYKILF